MKNVKNTHGGVLLLVKLQALACNFTKSSSPPWVFFTFFKLYKCYQIAQNITTAHLNPIQDGGGKKTSSSFAPLISINVRITPKNFLTFRHLAYLCKISRPYLVPVTNYSTWTKSTPQKMCFPGQLLIKLRLW